MSIERCGREWRSGSDPRLRSASQVRGRHRDNDAGLHPDSGDESFDAAPQPR